MKKMSKFALFTMLLIILPIYANAEARFKVECDKDSLARGESVACSYKMEKDAIDSATITELNAVVKATKDLVIQGFEIGPLWVGNNNVPNDGHEGRIELTSQDPKGISDTSALIGRITVRLSPDAVECGAVCISVESYVMGGEKFTGNEECADFSIAGDSPTTPPPETGAFASYAVLVGGAVLALSTIAVAKSKSKFYHI